MANCVRILRRFDPEGKHKKEIELPVRAGGGGKEEKHCKYTYRLFPQPEVRARMAELEEQVGWGLQQCCMIPAFQRLTGYPARRRSRSSWRTGPTCCSSATASSQRLHRWGVVSCAATGEGSWAVPPQVRGPGLCRYR